MELYQRGLLAVVHACGPTEPLLSHFDAMRLLEQASGPTGPKDGWLGRHLSSQTNPSGSPFRAIGSGLDAAAGAAWGCRCSGVGFAGRFAAGTAVGLEAGLHDGFGPAVCFGVESAARPTDAAPWQRWPTVDRLVSRVDPGKDHPESVYPSVLLNQLELVARLIKAEVGLEAAVLTQGGWDTHLSQVKEIEHPMLGLGWALRIFVDSLGDRIDRVTVGRPVRVRTASRPQRGRRHRSWTGQRGAGLGRQYPRRKSLRPLAGHRRPTRSITTAICR